jgi:hypothetical protein
MAKPNQAFTDPTQDLVRVRTGLVIGGFLYPCLPIYTAPYISTGNIWFRIKNLGIGVGIELAEQKFNFCCL